MGHEFIGVVEAVGADVRTVKPGDVVVAPFALVGRHLRLLPRRAAHLVPARRQYGGDDVDGGQGEAVRVPQADGTLVVLPVGEDDALMPSLLTLSDVMGTGHHAALAAQRRARQDRGRRRRRRRRPVRRDRGASGSAPSGSSSSAATPNGSRSAREFGATDVVGERGDEAVERVRELTGGFGAHSVLECVGHDAGDASPRSASPVRAAPSAASACRSTTRSRRRMTTFFDNVTISGGPAPARAYIEELLPDVLEGRIEPGRVFDRVDEPRRGAGRLPRDERRARRSRC